MISSSTSAFRCTVASRAFNKLVRIPEIPQRCNKYRVYPASCLNKPEQSALNFKCGKLHGDARDYATKFNFDRLIPRKLGVRTGVIRDPGYKGTNPETGNVEPLQRQSHWQLRAFLIEFTITRQPSRVAHYRSL